MSEPTTQRTIWQRSRAVRQILDAAKQLVTGAPIDELVATIADSTGLSTAGVELALARHLETDATDEEIRALVDKTTPASKVLVILSSNVFVGALRAIAIASASAPEVIVRPSRRDPAFTRALVSNLHDESVQLIEDFEVDAITSGEVHVYGTDETIQQIRAEVKPGVIVRGHGSGMGACWIGSSCSVSAAAAALADDVVVFDQRGCLSPRVALVEGDLDRADAFASALHAELSRLDAAVPRGLVPTDQRAACDRYVATMTYACRALVGVGHAIGVAPPLAPLVLAPPYRHVHVAACLTPGEARRLLAPLDRGIVSFGSDDLEVARTIAPRWARVSLLGRMQRPPLDGPVDLRPH